MMIGRWIGIAVLLGVIGVAPRPVRAIEACSDGAGDGLRTAVLDYQHSLDVAVRLKRAGNPIRAALTAAQAADDLGAASLRAGCPARRLVSADPLHSGRAVPLLRKAAAAARALAAAQRAQSRSGTAARDATLARRRDAAFQAYSRIALELPTQRPAALAGAPTTGVLYTIVSTQPMPGDDPRRHPGVSF
jgi:hypothetical protein